MKQDERTPGLFRKKPVVINAHQWFKNGDHPEDYKKPTTGFENGHVVTFSSEHRRENNWEGSIVRYFRRPDVSGESLCKHCQKTMHEHGWIDTLEGGHIVCPGDFIITGVKGEHYPCKPDIFAATYEPAEACNAYGSTDALRSALQKIDEAINDPARDGDFLGLLEGSKERLRELVAQTLAKYAGDAFCSLNIVFEENSAPWPSAYSPREQDSFRILADCVLAAIAGAAPDAARTALAGSAGGRIKVTARGVSIRVHTWALAELASEMAGPGAEIRYVPEGSDDGWCVWTEGETWPDEDDFRYHLFALEVKRLRRERHSLAPSAGVTVPSEVDGK